MFRWNWSSTLVSRPHAGRVGRCWCPGAHPCSTAPSPEHSGSSRCSAHRRGVAAWREMKLPSSPAAPLACLLHQHALRAGVPQLVGDLQGWTMKTVTGTHLQRPGIPRPRLAPALAEIAWCPGVVGYILQPRHEMQFAMTWTEDCGREVLPAAPGWFWSISPPARTAHSNASGMAVTGRAQGLRVLGGPGALPGNLAGAQDQAPPAHGARLKCSQACVGVPGGNFPSR